ncbi:MAG: putative RDD family membrane protein YckC [Bacteroidia bacterium]
MRVAASLIDTVLLIIVIAPFLTMIYGADYWQVESVSYGFWDVLVNYIFPAVAVILFWVYKSATPGKMVLKLTIVDAKTGAKPSTSQLIGRYFGYYVSAIPLLLGLIWVGIDKRKQGWHDKLAGTLVIRDKAVVRDNAVEPVQFEKPV